MIQKDSTVQIAQPAVFPTELVGRLTAFFEGEPAVNAAYVALMKFPNTDEPTHYAFGIDGYTPEVKKKLGQNIEGWLKSGEFVDFMAKNGSLGGCFDTITPFYKKRIP